MMLQDLLTHAIEKQWFAPSYKGPLQSYIKQYAQALGYDARQCPPAVYHQSDIVVQEKILDASEHDGKSLDPRSIQARCNGVLMLLHRAVDEGCLPSLVPVLPPRGSLHRERKIGAYLSPDPSIPQRKSSHYGLKVLPAALRSEVSKYLQWCTPEIERGRPSTIRKGASACNLAEHVIKEVAGYAVNVLGQEKDSLTLRGLCEPAFLEDFAWWWLKERRGISTSTLRNKISIMKTIARHWFKDEDLAFELVKVYKRLKNEAPPRPVLDKEGRALSLEELDRIGRACHPFHEDRLKASAHARMNARHMADPIGHPLCPSHRSVNSTNGSNSFAHMATWFEIGLIIRLLIHRPLRIGNIANLKFTNLQPRPDGGYDIVIPKGELKNGKFMQRKEWREHFPTRLLPLLKEWLEVWRPRLTEPDTRDAEHPRKPRYHVHEAKRKVDAQTYVFLNSWGLQYVTSKLSNSIELQTLRLTHDRPGGPIAWFPHNIRTTWTREMLHAGLNPYILARIHGDTFKIITQHYGGFEQDPPSPFALQLAKEIGQDID